MLASPSSHLATLVDACRRYFVRLVPYSGSPLLFLKVDGGLQDGCEIGVQKDEFTIGALQSCDLVLLDAEIEGELFKVTVAYSIFGPLAVVTFLKNGGVINGIDFSVGESTSEIRLPFTLPVSDSVYVTVSKLASEHKLKKRRSRLGKVIRKLSVATGALLLPACVFALFEFFDERRLVSRVVTLNEPARSNQATSPVGIDSLRARIRESGLEKALSVSENEDGVLMVKGKLADLEFKSWREIASWYDAMSIGAPIIIEIERSIYDLEFPPITMIRLNEPQEIFLATGEGIVVGERFSEDWRLESIQNDHIVISNGEEQKTFRYADP